LGGSLKRYSSQALVVCGMSVCLIGCEKIGTTSQQASSVATPTPPTEWFIDATTETHLDFVHVNGMTGQLYYPEIIAPGVALLDFDNDEDLDVFLAQGGRIDRRTPAKTGDLTSGGRLYRNDLEVRADGRRVPRFSDVTEESGIKATQYSIGAAVGDFNNDGCVDLYVTALGRNQLFRNQCDGTFTEVPTAGVNDAGWSVSAAFLDFDRDGWLDLFVGHYLNWDPSMNTPCFGPSGARVYCAPAVYVPQQSHLFRNQRDGTFRDVTARAGMAVQFGPALGVTTADFNRDGWIDFYVANDGQENQLWINQRDGTFKDLALIAGAAWSDPGKPKAGMGVDAGDFDDDGDDDVFVTNLSGEGHDLYVNDGSGHFEPRNASSGIKHPSLPFTGFGTAWVDIDNDGALDILTVNGTVQRIDALVREKDPLPLRQRKQLFRNLGNGRFEDVTSRSGPAFERADVGRGAAFGDIDNDGDTDVIVGNNNGPAQVLLNTMGTRKHWIGLRLVAAGTAGRARDMLGARAAVLRDGLPTLERRVRTDGSFASANDARVLVGLGTSNVLPHVRVTWPDGRIEEWADVPIDRYTTLVTGSGK
jgi:hypothetical protein